MSANIITFAFMERINWIDWGKFVCMTMVVFSHLPQHADSLALRYCSSVVLASFFFLSGYLKKPVSSIKTALRKYWNTLLLPYLVYNLLFFPYWLARHLLESSEPLTFTTCLKPFVGIVLPQLNSNFSCEMNGITWFLVALFLMHLLTDLCQRLRHGGWLLGLCCVATIVLYGANKYWHYAPNLTYNGFVRCLTFYAMGYLFRQQGLWSSVRPWRDVLVALLTLSLSIVIFYWHIHETRFVIHIVLFYVVNILSVFGILGWCKAVSPLCSKPVVMVSTGTMVVMGLHPMMIGIVNFMLEHLLSVRPIFYTTSEALGLALAIEFVLLPVIAFCYRHCPLLLGKHSQRLLPWSWEQSCSKSASH